MRTAYIPRTAELAPGSQLGPWQVLECRGQGTYGTVYRAVRLGHESQGPVALKLALFSEDPRFAREQELLSRVQHASVPCLEDSGLWQQRGGASYPYLVMQWVEGTSLYEWAERRPLSSRQAMQLLAQLAHALEATHSAGGLHRDVKGSNVLVRQEDGRAFLTDFGSGHYRGAATLTWQVFPPGTPAYRSPEAWRFALSAPLHSHYVAGPADDVFALGVTAYRLVTGDYPPSTDPRDEEAQAWRTDGTGPRPPHDLNTRCCTELSALILRMLSLRPEARGSARELAEALESTALSAGPEADTSLWDIEAPEVEQACAPPPPPVPSREPRHAWGLYLMAASAVLVLALLTRVSWPAPTAHLSSEHLTPPPLESSDGGSAGVADATVEAPEDLSHARPPEERIARKLPPKPLPGQLVPDAKGHCRSKVEVPINGGCWVPLNTDIQDCKKAGYFEHQGGCYLPVPELAPRRPPLSNSAAGDAQP